MDYILIEQKVGFRDLFKARTTYLEKTTLGEIGLLERERFL